MAPWIVLAIFGALFLAWVIWAALRDTQKDSEHFEQPCHVHPIKYAYDWAHEDYNDEDGYTFPRRERR